MHRINAEFLTTYGWLVAILIVAFSCSWTVLLLQAFFHDRRIALVGLTGGLLAGALALLPGPLATVVAALAVVVNLVFLVWFALRYWNRSFVYVPLVLIAVSMSVMVLLVLLHGETA